MTEEEKGALWFGYCVGFLSALALIHGLIAINAWQSPEWPAVEIEGSVAATIACAVAMGLAVLKYAYDTRNQ